MDAKRIHKYFAEDYILSKGDLLDIENTLSELPYFQSLRFTYLKGCYTLDYVKFKSELDRMAIFLSDREALFFFIFKNEFAHLLHEKKIILSSDKTLELINAFFEVTDAPITSNLEIDVSTKNLATTDYLSFLDGIEEKRAKKSQTSDKVNISTGLITLETIDETSVSVESNDNIIVIDEGLRSMTTEEVRDTQNADLISLETTDNDDKDIQNIDIIEESNRTNEISSVNLEKKPEALILIEEFEQLVKDNKPSKSKIEDTESGNLQVESQESSMIQIETIVDLPLATNEIIEVGAVDAKAVAEQSVSIKEEEIEERDYNTIGSEEMSILITQCLEESLEMIQEMRKNAQSVAKKKDAIIDDFLSKELKPISLDKTELHLDQDDYSLDNEESEEGLDEGFFTATLAKIYTKQGRYDKAYEIIKHLSLKVSNKNVYFVEQLNYLEELISKKNKIK